MSEDFTSPESKPKIISKFLLPAILALALSITSFFPTLVFDYVPFDQWQAFSYSVPQEDAKSRFKRCWDFLPRFYLATGRPLVWQGECLEHGWVAKIKDFLPLRWVCILIVAGTILTFGILLRRVTGSIYTAIFISATFTWSPGYAFMYMEGLTAGGVLLSLLFAVISVYFILDVKRFWEKGQKKQVYRNLGISFSLFFASLCGYPSFSYVVIPLSFLILFFSLDFKFKDRLAEFFGISVFYGACSLVYFLIFKAVSIHKNMGYLKGYTFSLSGYDLFVSKANMFFEFLAKDLPFINFFEFTFSLSFLSFVALILSSFLVGRNSKWSFPEIFKLRKIQAYYLVLSGMVVLISMWPWWISQFPSLQMRHTFPVTMFFSALSGICILFLARGCLKQNVEVKSAIILFFLLVIPGLLQQNRLSFVEVLRSDVEIRHVRSAIKKISSENLLFDLSQIHVIRPDPDIPYTIRLFKESVPATMENPRYIYFILSAVLREYYSDEELRKLSIEDCRFDFDCLEGIEGSGHIALTQSNPGEPIKRLPKSYLIDFTEIQVGMK